MSSASAPAAVFTPPPPGLNYTAALDPSIKFLLIGTACSATLIPIAVMLFFFSTPSGRRQPVFILNVFIIALGLAEGGVNIYNQTRSMLALPVSVELSIAFACSSILVPALADTVLLLRVFTVYRPSQMTTKCIAAIYGPISMVKIARMVVEIVFVVRWSRAIAGGAVGSNILIVGQIAWRTPYVKAAWVLQLADSSFASAIFLFRLRKGRLRTNRIHVPGADNDTNISGTTQNTYYDRLRTLFWISASNFVFPVVLDLTLLVLAFSEDNFLTGTYVLMVSNYVDIIGVLLATIWSTSTKYAQPLMPGGEVSEFRTTRSLSPPRFAVSVTTVEERLDSPSSQDIPMTVFKPAGTSGAHTQA
ncbi:hypothetical protein BD309DRAFT_208803 [Dichomitus squalens]|uniref:Uncharacterized protein n=2 Tax=Dichomitus squalens TaxID=114155 RepID=A0A4Q9NNA7_9APHY|nr:uncharacterized protein DICSQDRAFT_90063 [Dichomitus squalens LYAD-421 SS1]EJF58933.1 hypothetical protein DICSQDRAFT_90063 [Dichomitus squalens LYAD-421 SS1]TBU42155.1 hypothetical protein BD309DRAFT_208803 [Dichomitus squalens]TBU56020.1 hypothetical protein BD310DRAFT_646374 [Dichomitus squalens]